MLELRQNCENCNKALAPNSTEAMICTYECTFCDDCVTNILYNVCPNCSGGFEKRPVRPKGQLKRNPPSTTIVLKPIDALALKKRLDENIDIPPNDR
jgi:hypothetical protein